jgi:hypothetical protein
MHKHKNFDKICVYVQVFIFFVEVWMHATCKGLGSILR